MFILQSSQLASENMSSRRKRALPVKVDEEKQQQLRWNMHEDRRDEPLTLTHDEHPCPSSGSRPPQGILLEDSLEKEGAPRDAERCPAAGRPSKSAAKEGTVSLDSSVAVKLNIVVSPHNADDSWKVLLGELTLHLPPEQSLSENFSERSFTLMNSEWSNQFWMYIHSESENVENEKKNLKEPVTTDGKGILVESSFSNDMLEDLEWLQKKGRLRLYQRPEGNCCIKVLVSLMLLQVLPHFQFILRLT